MATRIPSRSFAWLAAAALILPAAWAQESAPAPARRAARAPKAAAAEVPRLTEQRNGTLPTRDGQRLRLNTDLGNVHVLTGATGQVTYTVRIETDSREPDAERLLKQYSLSVRGTPGGMVMTGQVPWHEFRGRLWVNYEVNVPREYNVDVVTQAGNIEIQDLDGRATLITSGGNITAGRLGGKQAAGARLETQGGHITVRDVAGELRATTAGGHITAANVEGDAILHSGGGHIRAGVVGGGAQLDTGGGNISIQRAGGSLSATTTGGQVELGEAAGAIHARTAGGVIRVLRVSGPTTLETGGGSILLTRVQSAVHALTAVGTITAWFTPDGKLVAPSQLESRQGDIVVYLPRALPITIEATIDMAGEHRIEAEPSLPMKVSYSNTPEGGRALRGECTLNGGGEVLKLRAVAGNIRLRFSDTDAQMEFNRKQMEQLKRRLEFQQQRMMDQIRQQVQVDVEQQMANPAFKPKAVEAAREAGRMEAFSRKFELLWRGALYIDENSQQKKLVQKVQPVYPDVARQAGLEGTVRLRVYVGEDGAVRDVKVLSGERTLADAAVQAVRQWRYAPMLVDDKPVSVITNVTVEFRLR